MCLQGFWGLAHPGWAGLQGAVCVGGDSSLFNESSLHLDQCWTHRRSTMNMCWMEKEDNSLHLLLPTIELL